MRNEFEEIDQNFDSLVNKPHSRDLLAIDEDYDKQYSTDKHFFSDEIGDDHLIEFFMKQDPAKYISMVNEISQRLFALVYPINDNS